LGATINELFEKGEKFVGLNLSESESFFSEMAGLIKKWNWKIKETGGCFCLIEPNVQTRRRLSLMGLDRFVAVYDREEEIVAKAVPAGA
jgi:anti-anti-sigma regulatory factor